MAIDRATATHTALDGMVHDGPVKECRQCQYQMEEMRLRASNAEMLALLARLVQASDRQVSALLLIEEARAVVARAQRE